MVDANGWIYCSHLPHITIQQHFITIHIISQSFDFFLNSRDINMFLVYSVHVKMKRDVIQNSNIPYGNVWRKLQRLLQSANCTMTNWFLMIFIIWVSSRCSVNHQRWASNPCPCYSPSGYLFWKKLNLLFASPIKCAYLLFGIFRYCENCIYVLHLISVTISVN